MTRSIRTELPSLINGLQLLDHLNESRTDNPPNVHSSSFTQEAIMRRAIGDLDFDGFYFLQTGKESPEGWAINK